MSVRCGFHGKDVVRHETPTDVRVCSKLHYEAKELAFQEEYDDAIGEFAAAAERAAELAVERFFEERGSDEAYAQERWEAERGVISFDVAYENALRGHAEAGTRREESFQRTLGMVEPAPSNHDRYAAWRQIPVGTRGYGYFALDVDGVVKFYRVERPKTGKYAGKTYVKVQAAESFHRLPYAVAGSVLDKIAKDPEAAGKRYAAEAVRCYRCNTQLTDDDSRARGMGPDCAGKA